MAATDDKAARRFSSLFRELSPDIVAYCGWRARCPSDAQDAVAEVFLTAWRRLDEVPEGDAARVWLYATARRVIANQRRANGRRARLHERLTAMPVAPPASETAPDPLDERVHAALRRLKPRDREVLLLAEWEGFSPAEIAAVMGCAGVTARGRLHRARRRFRQAFEELEPDPEPRAVRRGPAEHGSTCRTRTPEATVRAARPVREGDRS